MELHGTRVLITGASRGIGAGLARGFAGAGAEVALVARSAAPLRELADELGGRAYPTDLLDRAAVAALWDRVTADGPVHVLVNNAGIDTTEALADFAPDALDAVLELNLRVPIQLSGQALPAMLAQRRGHIVNVSSMAGAIVLPGQTAYGASKAGLSHFTAGLRADLRAEADGAAVGTTLVEIGPVQTEMMETLRAHEPARRALRRFELLRLSYDLPVDRVVDAIVGAVADGRDHVWLPRRAAVLPLLVEVPRRIGELITLGAQRRRR